MDLEAPFAHRVKVRRTWQNGSSVRITHVVHTRNHVTWTQTMQRTYSLLASGRDVEAWYKFRPQRRPDLHGIRADFSVLARFQVFCLILESRFLFRTFRSDVLSRKSLHVAGFIYERPGAEQSLRMHPLRFWNLLRRHEVVQAINIVSFGQRVRIVVLLEGPRNALLHRRGAVPRHSLPRTRRLIRRAQPS